MYKNTEQYASSARALTKTDLDKWYAKYIDSSITDSWNASFQENDENKLISIVGNQMSYWLGQTVFGEGAYYVWAGINYVDHLEGYVSEDDFNAEYGVRVLVTLTPEIKFEETLEEVEEDGFSYNKWIIK